MSKINENIRKGITNSRTQDSAAKLIFGNNRLCSQFLRNYSGIELLKNVREEDIEDMTTRYIPMFTEERDSDVVKRVRLSNGECAYMIALIEHKSTVDYNVSMQLLRYMVYIWEDYEKEQEKLQEGISKRKPMGQLFEHWDSGPDEELREQGRAEERKNTEAERRRADAEQQRADAAEAENARLREEIARLKSTRS